MRFIATDWHHGSKITARETYEGQYVADGELILIFYNDDSEPVVLPTYLFEEEN